jgi:Big-like domain-containing protein
MTQFKVKKLVGALAAMAVLLPAAHNANAALERMGPINTSPTVGGFPSWFQDQTGLTMEFCDLTNQSELTGGWCTLIPPTPSAAPESFPNNFFIEHFYHDANTSVSDGTTKARLIMAVEASFAGGAAVVPGQQMTFGRIRVFITHVPSAGTYTVYHPYGKWTFNGVAAGDRIFFTEDVGLACVATFTCTLGTTIGPFLLPSPTPGGVEVPPIPDIVAGQDPFYDILVNTGANKPYPGTGKKYVTDPGRIGPVTGSPLPPFVGNDGVTYNHNVFRVEGPAGFALTTTDFTVTGRLMTGGLPSAVTVDRASFAETAANGIKVDVMATGQPTMPARLPAQPVPTKTAPIINFWDAPCSGTIDPNTGALIGPFSAPVGANQIQMVNADVKYWGQAHPLPAVPASVCVVDQTSVNSLGQIVPTFYNVAVVDEVQIAPAPAASGATYNPALGGSLTVTANSSETVTPPSLSLLGYGPMVGNTITVSPLAAPPAKVTVLSTDGGTTDLLVTTGFGNAGSGVPALANNDTFTINEDCSPTAATSCAVPPVFNVLANDTVNGGPVPAGATVTIVTPPKLGTAVINADQTITYTPNANANGTDAITYTVTNAGAVSNTAQATINITPINDLPVAVNDSFSGILNRSNVINVIANDTDVDSPTDVANAQIVTWPAQLGAQPVPANGVLTFTPTAQGTFSFTYNAVDRLGAVSAAPATVTFVVGATEAITIAKAIFKAAVTGAANTRWTVQGTDSVRQGETLTVVYNNGTLNAANGGGTCNGTAANPKCVIGTAVVDSLGNYLYDVVGLPGGPSDPTDVNTWTTKPTVIKVFSSNPVLGGSNTSGISVK